MRIHRVNLYKVSLPFSGAFAHARSAESSALNFVAEVVAREGAVRGYGEGAPRLYLSEETEDKAFRNMGRFVQHDAFPWDLEDTAQVWSFVDDLPQGEAYSAAVCALETALLDALARSQDRPIIQFFPTHFYTQTVHYSAPVTLGAREKVEKMCRLIKGSGIRHVRVKVGEALDQNREELDVVRSVFGDACDLRVDANGVWDMDLAFRHLPLIREHGVRVLEEPMAENAPGFPELADRIQAMGVLLMACQSASTLKDVRRLVERGLYSMINVKLSRSGGFRRAFQIIDYLRERQVPFQIGCQRGESGILSAAGRVFCLLNRDALYYDGSYDAFLLKENLTTQNVTFGYGGEAGPLEGPGLGITINPDHLRRLSENEGPLTIERP
jgi:muconate cycloisomerase